MHMTLITNDRNGLPLYLGDHVSYILSGKSVLAAEIKISDNLRAGDYMLSVIQTSAHAQSNWGTEIGTCYYFFSYHKIIYWDKAESTDWWDIWGVQ
jgi:hypothetical protein